MAHIHFGQPGVNGGVIVWLCTAGPTAPAGTPACPQSGTVTGTLTPSSVVGPSGQGITAGEWNEFLAAVRKGLTYANVHSTIFPAGEIRGQLAPGAGR
jgi:hypothetical protein